MKCQILFSGKTKKNLSSAVDFTQSARHLILIQTIEFFNRRITLEYNKLKFCLKDLDQDSV